MPEALRPERENYGPAALTKPQESLGARIDPETDIISVDFDSETADLLASLGIEQETADPSATISTNEADEILGDVGEKEERYYSASSKVYEVAMHFDRSRSPMSEEDRGKLELIQTWITPFVVDEQKVIRSAEQNIQKLEQALGHVTDDAKREQVADKVASLKKARDDAQKRVRQHIVFSRYIDMLFQENNQRIAGKANGKPDLAQAKVEPVPAATVEQNFNEAVFIQELESNIPGYTATAEDLSALFSDADRTALDRNYPRIRKGPRAEGVTTDIPVQIDRVKADLRIARTLLGNVDQFLETNYPLQAALTKVDVNKRQYIERKVKPWIVRLIAQLETQAQLLAQGKDRAALSSWERDTTTGLARSEFQNIRNLIDRVNRNTSFTSMKDFIDARNGLINRHNALTANNAILIEGALKTLRDSGAEQALIDAQRQRIVTDYLNAAEQAVTLLDQNALQFWETTRVQRDLLAPLRALEAAPLNGLQAFTDNYNQRQAEITKLAGMQAGLVNELPPTVRGEAQAYINQQLTDARDRQAKLIDAQTSFLDMQVLLVSRQPMQSVEAARRDGLTAAASETDNTQIDRAIQALDAADAALAALEAAVLPQLITDPQRLAFRTRIQEERRQTEEVRAKLRDRKQQNVAEAQKSKVEASKTTLSSAVTNILLLDDDKLDKLTLAELTDQYITPLRQAEVAARTAGIDIEADQGFTRASERVRKAKEIKEIREMSFAEVVRIAKSKRYDVFKSESTIGSISDPYEREIIKKFQSWYYKPTESLTTDVERTEHRQLKVEMWAFRYTVEHDDGKYVPAANVTDAAGEDVLYSSMKNRALVREDVLAVTQDRSLPSGIVREMYQHAIDAIAGDIDTPGFKLDYGSLANNENGENLMQEYLKERYVETGRIPEAKFNVLWDIFVSFDLASIGLVRAQKGTKTRSHNPGKKVDTEFLSYPLHVMSHMRNRYGNVDTAAQHLLVFTGEYPDDTNGKGEYLWAGNEHNLNGTHVRTEEETRKLVKAYMKAYMPLNGIEGHVLLSGTNAEWNQAVFPDHLDFLTAPISTPKLPVQPNVEIADTIGNLDLYRTAQDGWNRMLEMSIRSLDSPLSLHDIFKDGGVYKQFVNDGIGKAKVVKGEHYRWFVPMLRYFVGRVSVAYGDQTNIGRRLLKDQLVEQMKIATGLQIPEIQPEIDAFVNEIKSGVQYKKWGPGWNGIPEMLIPYDDQARLQERIEYMKLWWRDRKKGASEPPTVSVGVSSAMQLTAFRDPDIKLYYDAIYEREPLPQIIDRTAFNKDTSDKQPH